MMVVSCIMNMNMGMKFPKRVLDNEGLGVLRKTWCCSPGAKILSNWSFSHFTWKVTCMRQPFLVAHVLFRSPSSALSTFKLSHWGSCYSTVWILVCMTTAKCREDGGFFCSQLHPCCLAWSWANLLNERDESVNEWLALYPKENLKHIHVSSCKYVNMKEVKEFWVKEQIKINYIQEEVWFEYRGPQADSQKL